MNFRLVAVGRGMPGPVAELVREYQRRLVPIAPVTLTEVAEEKRDGGLDRAHLLAREGVRLRKHLVPGMPVIPLDLAGRTLSSPQLADTVNAWQLDGVGEVCFVIGGPDGLDGELLKAAPWSLSLGPMTFPHMLVRVLLLEQLYRAMTILHRLPYHR